MKTNVIHASTRLTANTLRLAASLFLLGVSASHAQQLLYTIPSTQPTRVNVAEANGIRFETGTTNQVISHLGFYSTNTVRGLGSHHPVGIYTGGNTWVPSGSTVDMTNLTLIRQVDVPAGITNASGVVTNSYYYNKVYWVQLDPPLILSPNTYYVLLGQGYSTDSDYWVDDGTVTCNSYYIGGNSSVYAAFYGPGGTTWPVTPTMTFTRNGIGKAYVEGLMGNLPQGPATLALVSTNSVALTGGQTLAISGFACGQTPIVCQWWRNGVAIPGQTGPNLSIPNAWDTNDGTYYLTASNTISGTTYGEQSPSINVVVYTTPTNLVVSPATYGQTETLYVGANANFTVSSVSGVSPFTYQWYTNGALDATAISTNYSYTNLQVSSPSTFTCIVTNVAGSVTNTWTISVVPPPTASYPATILAANPIGYWRLNEADNNLGNGNFDAVANDYWGGNSGVYSNTVLSQAGYGQGLANEYGYSPATDAENSALFRDFPSTTTSNSFVGNINNVGFSTATNNSATFSVEAWVNGATGQISGAGLVSKGTGGGGEQFDLDVYNNDFRFFIRDAGGTVRGPTSTFPVDGKWHHVVGVVDEVNSNISLYVDSQYRWSSTCSPSNGILSSAAPVSIGARRSSATSQYDLQFAGNINDVAIYNYALSSNQVFAHYTAAGIAAHFLVKSVAATNVNQGTELILPTTVVGTLPVSYQWYDVTGGYPGTPLANQTSPTLDIPNIQAASFNGHTLALIASNSFGQDTNQVTLTVYSVPFFTTQPPSTLSVYAGGSATWTVATVGPQPISYIWLSNGVPIISATNTTLAVSNLQAGASYSCLASNSLGTSTSSAVVVTVLPSPTAAYPMAVMGDRPLGYWRLNESDNGAGNNGAVANDYWGGNSGTYSNTILGNVGYSTALASQYNYSPATDPETSAQFGYYPAAYATNNYAGSIPNINFATPTNNSANFSVEAWVNGDYQQDGLSINAAGIVAKGAWGAEQFTLDTGGATPTSYYYRFSARDAGGSFHSVGTNTCVPDGKWHHLVGVMDQSHSNLCLYVDGLRVAMAACSPSNGLLSSSVPLSIGSRLSSGGGYGQQFYGNVNDMAVYNFALSSNQVMAHYVAAGIPPSFTLQPPSYTNVNEGTTLVIPTQVTGTPSLSYQWYDLNTSAAIPGQTNSTLVISDISQAEYNGHTLSLTATNIFGQVTSSSVSLAVNSGPPNTVMISPSAPPSMYVGLPITFTATAQGTQPFSYFWTLDNTPVTGANSSTFVYTSISGTHSISCTVSNSEGSSGNSVSITGVDAPMDAYGVQILNDQPIAFLRLDEPASSGTAYDYVGGHDANYYLAVNGLNGFSPSDTAETASGFGMNGSHNYSMALEYDQSSTGTPNIDFSTQGANAHFSIEAWVNAPAGQTNGAGIVAKGYGNGGEQFCMDVNGGHFRFFVRSATGTARSAQSSNIGPDGTWHHLTGICDEANGAVRLYIDGVLNTSGSMVPGEGLQSPLPVGASILTSIGCRMTGPNDAFYTGQLSNSVIAQVAMYNYALSSSQVSAHYQAAAEPPAISVQPSPASYERYQGPAFSYFVSASGSPPLAYQWYKNGVALPGQTGTNLNFADIMPSDTGAYIVIVTNINGSATSTVATLTVIAPVAAYENQVLTDNAADYWRFNETNSTTAYDYIGGLNATYGSSTTNGVPGPSAPAFEFETNNTAVAMDHPLGGSTSYVTGPTLGYSNNTFTVTCWVYPVADVTNYQGVFFTRASTYPKGITYIAVPGRNNMIGYCWNQNNADTYGWASGLVTPPGQWSFVALTISPNQAVMYLGTNGILRSATNAIAHDSEAWNGAVLIGADTASSDRTFLGSMDEVSVFNRTLSGTDVASLYSAANVPQAPQAILSSQYSAYVGFPFSMTVQTTGGTPSGYQWLRNGTNLVDGGTISGSQSSTLAFSTIASSDANTYQVIVTNQGTAISSDVATLTVLSQLEFNGPGSGWSTNGFAAYSGANTLRVTDGGKSENSSSFFSYPVYVGGFQASFTYQDVNGAGADGAAFVVQNDPRGQAALGANGGALGYSGISNSAAVEFNLYSANGVGYAFQTNGITGVYDSASPVNLASGDPINVSILYLNGTLSMTMTDTIAGTSFTTNTALNIPMAVGTNMAYVGFTGGDGSTVSSQVISNFAFVSLVEMSAQNVSGNQLSLSWPNASGGYVLQQNTNLTTGSWVPVPNVGTTNQVTLPATNGTMFYRLVQP